MHTLIHKSKVQTRLYKQRNVDKWEPYAIVKQNRNVCVVCQMKKCTEKNINIQAVTRNYNLKSFFKH